MTDAANAPRSRSHARSQPADQRRRFRKETVMIVGIDDLHWSAGNAAAASRTRRSRASARTKPVRHRRHAGGGGGGAADRSGVALIVVGAAGARRTPRACSMLAVARPDGMSRAGDRPHGARPAPERVAAWLLFHVRGTRLGGRTSSTTLLPSARYRHGHPDRQARPLYIVRGAQ